MDQPRGIAPKHRFGLLHQTRGITAAGGVCVMLAGTLLLAAAPAFADLAYVEWSSPELAALGVTTVGVSAGAMAAYTPTWQPWSARNEWHVVYAKDGDIWETVWSDGEWSVPFQVSNDPADSRSPRVAFGNEYMHVVWEDDRTGHAEVWTRRWNGSVWSPEECLSEDGVESRTPTIAGQQASGTYPAVVIVWADGITPVRQVMDRRFVQGAWSAVEPVSLGGADAFDPCVASGANTCVAWSDTRHGAAEIYARQRSNGPWETETRLTDLPGSCTHPNANVGYCCDNPAHVRTIAFENDQTGRPEVWLACWQDTQAPSAARISTSDAVASRRPFIAGHSTFYSIGPWLNAAEVGYVMWTEGSEHILAKSSSCGTVADRDTMSAAGVELATIAAEFRSPNAQLLSLWIEQHAGEYRLMAKRGWTLDCLEVWPSGPSSILLAPEGIPADTIGFFNSCGNDQRATGDLTLRFEFDLDSHLDWDPQQNHPDIKAPIDEDGNAVFSVRGGGCWPNGRAKVFFRSLLLLSYPGARSPDVDGNCVVDAADLSYVTSRIGSTDYCADLDGSGSVTQADLSIVQTTLGDHCSNVTSTLDLLAGGGPQLRLDVWPNPCRGQGSLLLRASNVEVTTFQVLDVSGRVVRELHAPGRIDGSFVLPWDGMKDDGSRLTAGVYVLRARGLGLSATRTFVHLP